MEDIHRKFQSIADINLIIYDFSIFCVDVHGSVGCQKLACWFEKFSTILSQYLERTDRTNDEKMLFFISHCVSFSLEFSRAYNCYRLGKILL